MAKLLSDKQNWVIKVPYILNQEDNDILRTHPPSKAKDWYNSVYKPIKDRIREHYYNLQNGTCCYCRLPLNKGTDNVEIEHIIDKNNRIDFMFTPKNLVISCHNCNFNKKTKKVMHNCPPENEYPVNSGYIKIIHGHFDNYFDNINLVINSTYQAKTDQGEFTIETCRLDRFGLAEQRERVTMYEDDEIIADVIDIRNSDNNTDKIDALIEKLKNLKNK